MGFELGGVLARVRERMFPPPIDTVAALGRFVGERAAFAAQTSLYGYLKTRMGTKFPRYFQDPGFAGLIREASVKLFVSSAADLAVHATAAAGDGRLGPDQCAALARRVFALALEEALAAADAASVPPHAVEAFDARARGTDWVAAATGEAAFAGSVADLVRVAPVAEEFKPLDRPIVRNSMRFRWREVRTELQRRLDAAAVCADWRAGSAA